MSHGSNESKIMANKNGGDLVCGVERQDAASSLPARRVLGIDLGGTKSAALVVSDDGDILCRVAGPTPAAGGPDAVVSFLIDLARQAVARNPGPIAGVGVSAGAPASARTGRVFPAPNLPGWPHEGVPMAQIVSHALNGLPVFLDNDANATALAEHRFGAGRGARDMAFLTVGTGIGAGLIVDGRLARGATEAGGEIGHVAVEHEPERARLCLCGLRGCLEAYASGPSLARVAHENGLGGRADRAGRDRRRAGGRHGLPLCR
jgi:glucokinase